MIQTYNHRYPSGEKTYGGYANYWRGPSRFAFFIPDGLDPAYAAPMLCGGITVYGPLKNYGCGPGKKVGVIGIGGLGHFALLFAKALGAEKLVAVSRTSAKKEDAMKLGADEFIATGEDDQWAEKNKYSLDLIISTVSSSEVCTHRLGCLVYPIENPTDSMIDAS